MEEFKEPIMDALWERNREGAFVVLLATCDQQISQELKQVLTNKMIELLTFDNAKDLLLTIAEKPIDLVIFDPCISELKGVGILSVIKRFKPKARVIVLEDDLSFEKQAAIVNEGVLYQIQKPVNANHISQVVEKVAEKLYHHC